jgi:hypothetical protein
MESERMQKFRLGLLRLERAKHIEDFEKSLDQHGLKFASKISYLDLAESFKPQGFDFGKDALEVIWGSGWLSADRVQKILIKISKLIGDQNGWLFLSEFPWVGGIGCKLSDVLPNGVSWVNFDSEMISIVDQKTLEVSSLVIDLNTEELNKGLGYEVLLCGEWGETCRELLSK